MSVQDCIKIKRKLTDPDDKASFDKNLKELTEGGVPVADAYPQAAELTMEDMLVERNELSREIVKKKGYLPELTITELLSPRKSTLDDFQTNASGAYSIPFSLIEMNVNYKRDQKKKDGVYSRAPEQISKLQEAVYAAYEADNMELAEKLDVELNEIYENYDNELDALDEDESRDGAIDAEADLEKDLSGRYYDLYINPNDYSGSLSPKEKADQLRMLLEDYAYRNGGMKEGVTDEQIVDAANDAYEHQNSLTNVSFSRSQGEGSTKAEVEAWLKDPLSKIGKWVKVEVKQSVSELPGDNNPDNARGMLVDGTIYIVADNITKEVAEVVFAHEVVGHLGLETLLGEKGFDLLVKNIKKMKKNGNRNIAAIVRELKLAYVDEAGNYTLDSTEEAREILAHMAEKHPRSNIIRDLWNRIKLFLSRLGVSNKIIDLDQEKVQELLIKAIKLTQTNDPGSQYTGYSMDPAVAGNAVAEPKNIDKKQRDLFDPKPEEIKTDQAVDNLYVQYKQVVTSEFKIGLTTINSPEDAAHAFAPIRKRAQEAFYALVLDKNNKPVNMIRHTEGLRASSSVDPMIVASAITNTPGATSVWFGHNHPSGELEPSQADMSITKVMTGFLDGTGIKYKGHLIVGNQGDAKLMPVGYGSFMDIKITPSPRNKTIGVTTRELRKRDKKADERMVINGTADSMKLAESLQSPNAIVLMNNKHKVIGILSMTKDEMSKLKGTGQLNRILKAIDTVSPSAVILVTESAGAGLNVAKMLNDGGGLRVLDNIYEENGVYKASGETGSNLENASGEWYSRDSYYSELNKQVEAVQQKKGSKQQWIGMLKKLTQKGVKQEEINWSGIDDFIRTRESQIVTKDEIIGHLKDNEVKLTDVTYSDEKKSDLEIAGDLETEYDGVPWIAEAEDGTWNLENDEGVVIERGLTRDQADDQLVRYMDDDAPVRPQGSTEFSEQTLPGGNKHKELLIKLNVGPYKKPPIDYNEAKRRIVQGREAIEIRLNDEFVINVFDVNNLNMWANEEGGSTYDKDKITLHEYSVPRERGFTGDHWTEPNVLLHVRYNERTGKNGEKILFIEEIQSDWHQAGRKSGYQGEELDKYDRADLDSMTVERRLITARMRTRLKELGDDYLADDPLVDELAEQKVALVQKISVIRAKEEKSKKGITNAPLKKSWQELAFRKMVNIAARNGFDSVGWTTGKQQADRYDLSKQIKEILYEKNDDGSYNFSVTSHNNLEVIAKEDIDLEKIKELVGKELAERIENGEGKDKTFDRPVKVLDGLDLKAGGEGMKGFYDRIIPRYANKFGKKYGSRAEMSEISMNEDKEWVILVRDTETGIWDDTGEGPWDFEKDAEKFAKSEVGLEYKVIEQKGVGMPRSVDADVWNFPITEKMRKTAPKGVPVFSRKKADTGKTDVPKMGANQVKGSLSLVKEIYPEIHEAYETRLARLTKKEATRVKANLKKFEGTGWAAVTIKGMAIRTMMEKRLKGEDVDSISTSAIWGKETLYKFKAMMLALEKGNHGLELFATVYNFVGNNRKAEQDISGSFMNCDPSLACAKFCYAVSANGRTSEIMKAEFTEMMAEKMPDVLAKRIASQYKMSHAAHAGLSLRLNDKGDLSNAQLKLIKELNKAGIPLQIFSKRPDLLRKIPDYNLKMLSVDTTNIQLALDNPDLQLAVTLTDDFTEDMIRQINDRTAVYLPVNLKGVVWNTQKLKDMYPDTFKDMKDAVCPVDGGKLKTQTGTSFVSVLAGDVKGLWTCTACDKLGAAGCFHGKNKTEQRKAAFGLLNIEVNEAQEMADEAMQNIRKELEKLKLIGGLNERSIETALTEIGKGLRIPRQEAVTDGEAKNSPEQREGSDQDSERDGGNKQPTKRKPVYSRRPKGETTLMVVGYDAEKKAVEVPTSHPSREKIGKLKSTWRKWLNKEGNLGSEAFGLHIEMQGMKNADEMNVKFYLGELQRATKKKPAKGGYGKSYTSLTEKQRNDMNLYLMGHDVDVPPAVKEALDVMRTTTDSLSNAVQKTLTDNMKYRLEALDQEKRELALQTVADFFRGEEVDWTGVDKYIASKAQLIEKIQGNMGKYLNRSYRMFDDPKWGDKVVKNTELMTRVREFFTEQLGEKYEGQSLTDAVEGEIQSIVSKAGTSDMLSFMSSRMLGQKDLSILKKKKVIPPVLLELLGEYHDPRVNFARSMAKMSYLVANHHFLKGLRENGMGVFLSREKRGRFGTKIKTFEKESMMPVTGLYATEEFVDALSEATQPAVMTGWLRAYLGLNSMVKVGKTVLSPVTAMRNFYSAFMFTVMNGHFNYVHGIKAWKHTWADLSSKKISRRAYLEKLVRLGVLHDNPYSAELKLALDDFANMDTLESHALAKPLKAGLNVAQSFYQAGDDFWKIIGFENDKAMLIKYGIDESKAEKEAARRIRDGYPTYSMVPKFIRSLRRFPFVGTFTSFPWEMIRTTSHQARMLAEDVKAGRTTAVANRTVGMAMAAGAAYALSQVSMTMMGIDDDDDENIRELAPPWQKNSQLAYLGYNEDGTLRFLDLSHLDPYTVLKKPITAVLNGNNEGFSEKAFDSMSEILSPFFGEEIGFGALNDAWYNVNHDTGRPIINPGAGVLEGAIGIEEYLRKRLQPGFIDNIERLGKSFTGKIENSGREYVLSDEGMSLLGFRMTSLDVPTSIRYKAFQFKDDKSNAVRIINRSAKSRGTVSEGDLKASLFSMRKSWNVAYRDMINSVQAAQALGLKGQAIYSLLTSAGISRDDARSLIRGETPKWKPGSGYFSKSLTRSLNITRQAEKRADIKSRFRNRSKMLKELLDQEELQ